jgi:Uma2 family endonuclease
MNASLQLDAETPPRLIVWDKPLSDDEFEALCRANDLFQLERTKDGEVLVHSPTGGFTGDGNAEIIRQLRNWWITHRRGRVFDSSSGFFLRDGSMRMPDAAYLLPAKLHGLGKKDLTGLPRLCPDFVIELLSYSDRLGEATVKMECWVENGAQLAWLIDPYQKQVFVYRPDAAPEVFTGEAILGSGPVDGFTFDLSEVWRCYEI